VISFKGIALKKFMTIKMESILKNQIKDRNI
jgi:hypothetical protein